MTPSIAYTTSSDMTDGKSFLVNPSLTVPDASPFCAENINIATAIRTDIAALIQKTILLLLTYYQNVSTGKRILS